MKGGPGLAALRAPAAALVMAAALAAVPRGGAAQASPYVPTQDGAYRDLDVLVAKGLVSGLILGQRPYARMAFARALAEARGSLGAKARLVEAVERLEVRFARELALLCQSGDEACPRSRAYAAPRQVGIDLTWADSPPRAVRTQLKSGLDADVNPLLQRNQGRVLSDGVTAAAEAVVDAVLAPWLAASVQPRVWLAEQDGDATADATLVRGYARAVLGNLSVEAGRNALLHGHAREAGVVLSPNARGLDVARLSMERPGRLPWIFRGLGPVGFSATVADMGRDQDTPGSKLIVFEGAVRPHRNLELGGAVLNHQGGGVGPDVSLGERLRDVFLLVKRRPFYWFPESRVVSDKAVAFDARLQLPGPGLEAYVEVLTTDDHDLFYKVVRQALWNDAAWTGGVRAWGLGGEGRVDLWVEASRVGLLPYTHHEFTTGLAVDRRILGSPLGPLGTGLSGGVDWTGGSHRVSVAGAWERHAGDTWRNPDDGFSRRYKVADNPDEIRARATLGWVRREGVKGVRTDVRLGWERVTRFGLTDRNRSNVMAQLSLGYAW